MSRFANTLEEVPYVEWEDFYQRMSMESEHTWRQGQHIGLIGKTGCGKTTVANALLPIREYVTVIATKPISASLDKFGRDNGYVKMKEWPKRGKDNAANSPRRILWPPARQFEDVPNQRRVVYDAFNDVYGVGGWCVYVDELRFITETLKLGSAVEIFLMQGRELGISFIGGMQRPKFVPLTVYSQSSHLFFWNEKDINNLERVSAINSVDSHFISGVVTNLPEHEFLYIYSPTGYMCRSKAPDPSTGR